MILKMYRSCFFFIFVCIIALSAALSDPREAECQCTPPCPSLGADECKKGQLVPRDDCPCCKVCLRGEGDHCDRVNNPCDQGHGLTCSSRGVCTAEPRCDSDTDCPDDRFCVRNVCADPCNLLQPCRTSFQGGRCITRNHESRCECPEGTTTNHEAKICLPVQDSMKPISFPGQEEKPAHLEKFSGKSAVIQVISTTHNSTTLLLPSDSGGILYYKESRPEIESSRMTIAKGERKINLEELSPNTRYTLKWTGYDGKSTKTEIITADGCRHSAISYAVGAKWHQGCETTCSCSPGGKMDCRPRCIYVAGSIQDEQCGERPSTTDPECCVEYFCEKGDNSVLDSSPLTSKPSSNDVQAKLIVTSRTHNSISVAWDDFRAGKPNEGYVTEYREVPSIELNIDIPWMKKVALRDQPTPTVTLETLKPNTLYEVRVGIYLDTDDRRPIAATETITVRTEPGCVYGNTSFGLGEFFQGCEERCSCAMDGSVRCSERCNIPYFKVGSFSNDPLCVEDPADGDECCVLVMCAHGDFPTGNEDYDQCANTVCGTNAECVSWPTLSEVSVPFDASQPGTCRCKHGFTGDPYNLKEGCMPDLTKVILNNSCHQQLKTYGPGEVFYQGCSLKCTCGSDQEIECQPRCLYFASGFFPEDPNGCVFEDDPHDDCCMIRICNSTKKDASPLPHSPSLDFDGCIYRNKSYAKLEEFTFDCDQRCLCMGFGDVSCSPRCPPVKETFSDSSVTCETLIDPADKCCNITICGGATPDIMKVESAHASTFEDVMSRENDMMMEKNMTMMEMEEENMTDMMHGGMEMKEDNMTDMMHGGMEMKEENMTDMMHGGMEMKEKNMTDMMHGEMEMKEKNMTDMMHGGMEMKEDMSEMNNTMVDEMMIMKNPSHDEMEMHFHNGKSITANETEMLEKDKAMMHEPLDTDDESATTHEVIAMTTLSTIEDEHNLVNDTDFLEKRFRTDDLFHPANLLEIINLNVIDSSTIEMVVYASQVVINHLLSSSGEELVVSYSHDSLVWSNMTIDTDEVEVQNMNELRFKVPGLDAHDAYQFKVIYYGVVSPTAKASLEIESRAAGLDHLEALPVASLTGNQMCEFNGIFYKPDETFYDECHHYCRCNDEFKVDCAIIECPRNFGLDLLDPGCIEWDDSEETVAVPPKCCGSKPRCKTRIEDLNCKSSGQTFLHLDILPEEIAGCDQHCQCVNAKVECENLCNPVQATPPFNLPCHQNEARLITLPAFPCCREWHCSNETADSVFPGFPGLLPGGPSVYIPSGPTLEEIDLPDIQDVTKDSARISFKIPQQYVGLPGGIYLRFTEDARFEMNPLNWQSEVIHEAGRTLVDSKWEYVKRDLMPGLNYTMQLALSSHLSKREITSPAFVVGTMMEVTTPLPRLDLDAHLSVSDIKNTSAKISWKQFDAFELKYIDGVRVRYWHGTKKFPMEGPMLYRESDNTILTDLYPDTKYTVDLFFIPQKGLTTTIYNTKNITFTTPPKPKDKYVFEIVITAGDVTNKGAKIMYSGSPEPEGKFINVYRIVYTSDGDLHDSHKLKIPKNKKEGFIMLTDLKPGVEYEVWLEAYLTNGGKKKSNVITIKTPPGDLPVPERSEKSETRELKPGDKEDYHSALVGVAILAAIACVAFLLLLVFYIRRSNQAKAHINSNKSAYDNPSYKTSEGQSNYGMELNGLKNTTNGNSRGDEP